MFAIAVVLGATWLSTEPFGAEQRGRAPGVVYAPVYGLKPNEGVFAYARISPSGDLLAYASETRGLFGRANRVETVVDLRSQQVLFTEPGIDAYWSNDGERMIFLSFEPPRSVAIRHRRTGEITRHVSPESLGDYFSWAVRDGRNMIMTIKSNYYFLDGDRAELPSSRVASCPGIGTGDRPLVSKDGRRVTTFVNGNVVVRNVDNCEGMLDTGLQGAKADFSWDGRYVAFHVGKAAHRGSEIVVVDTRERTMRTLMGLQGSAIFPSWTKDGRLAFRYDGPDYRGFMMASNVLALPARPLPASAPRFPARLTWRDLFDTEVPHRTTLVMVWSDWSAHAPDALAALQRLSDELRAAGADVGVATVVPDSSRREDIDRILHLNEVRLPELSMRPDRIALTGALNQIPTELLFRDDVLVEQRLGPQSYAELKDWIAPSEVVGYFE
jgi:hypothetical protein